MASQDSSLDSKQRENSSLIELVWEYTSLQGNVALWQMKEAITLDKHVNAKSGLDPIHMTLLTSCSAD